MYVLCIDRERERGGWDDIQGLFISVSRSLCDGCDRNDPCSSSHVISPTSGHQGPQLETAICFEFFVSDTTCSLSLSASAVLGKLFASASLF